MFNLGMSNVDDLDKLRKFLEHLDSKLDHFVTFRSKSFLPHNKGEYEEKIYLMREAWVETRLRFDELQRYLIEARPLEKMKSAGLTGSSLALKLALVEESTR